MKINKLFVYALLGISFVAAMLEVAVAQTTDADLQRRKAAAQARTAEANARSAEAAARTAVANSRRNEIANREAELKLLRAKTTVSGDLIETDISAYKAVSCAASDINQKVRDLGNQIDLLMIYSPRFANTMVEYSILMNQLELLKRRYEIAFRSIPEALVVTGGPEIKSSVNPITIIDPISQVRALAIDTLSLFRTDVQISGKQVVIGKDEFVAKVLNGVNVEAYYPEKMIPTNLGKPSKLLTLITELAEMRVKSKYIIEGKTDVDPRDKKRNEPRLMAYNAIYDNVFAQFFPASKPVEELPDDESIKRNKDKPRRIGKSTIVDFMRAELASEIMAAEDQKRKYWLDVHVTKAGSNRRNKSSAVLDIFTGGKRISFSGGAIVNYRIFNSRGRVLASDTILTYMPFTRSKKIAEYKCQNVKDIP